ncbi:MAG: hypothetical protein ACR2OB_10495 [Solirubrobacteraceae bacterium]
MRPTRPIVAVFAVLAIGGVAAGCGAGTHSPTAAVRPSAAITSRPDSARIVFLVPAEGASVGSTLLARVKVSGRRRVRFILDRGAPRLVAASAITYRQLAPGRHQLVAQLLASQGQPAIATATVRFNRRSATPATPPAASPSAPAPASTPPLPSRAPAPSTSSAAPTAPTPPAPPVAPHPAPPSRAHPPAGGGIPQGGGGDGDGDNRGDPSDGDGNV